MVEGPLIQKYLKALEENPRSRVFAPLAESYRRLGMHDRAIEILKDGMRYHPNYVAGYLSLAACYFDLGQFQLCYATLKPFVPNSRDNLRLQRLFAESCEKVGHDFEALETYKFLLFLNPKDKQAATKVAQLESEAASHDISSLELKAELFPVEKLKSSESLEEASWVEVSLHGPMQTQEEDENLEWQMSKGADAIVSSQPRQIEVEKGPLEVEREFVVSAATLTEEDEEKIQDKKEDPAPLITHTLVDLYCNQGHFERAEEILLKMLALNPKDAGTLEKLQTVRLLLREAGVHDEQEEQMEDEALLTADEESSRPEAEESDGRDRLMQIFDSRVAHKHGPDLRVKNLNNFLDRIRSRAQEKQIPTPRS